jgi:3-oxoacyl-[acyl-carrier-protein] synthase II
MGEGAAAIMLEELEHAQARGATILGEVIGLAASAVCDQNAHGKYNTAFRNVYSQALASAGLRPGDVGHVNAHGLATRRCDAEESQAIAEVFSGRKSPVPVTSAKSYFGNLGAGSGMVELIASVLALSNGRLFRTLNYETPDPECPVNVVKTDDLPAGDSFISANISPQGQASAVVVRQIP